MFTRMIIPAPPGTEGWIIYRDSDDDDPYWVASVQVAALLFVAEETSDPDMALKPDESITTFAYIMGAPVPVDMPWFEVGLLFFFSNKDAVASCKTLNKQERKEK